MAKVAEKTARSIRYRRGAAKLPLAKPLAEFDFTASPNEALACAAADQAVQNGAPAWNCE